MEFARIFKVMGLNVIKHFEYWLKINHLKRIKKYGLAKHLKFIFNFNVNKAVINLQANLSELPILKYPDGYYVREIDICDADDIVTWVNIINNSYSDATETVETFEKFIDKHPFLYIKKVFFILKKSNPVGTIAIGLYRKNSDYGGDARIAILPSERGRGLGLFAINYGFHFLRNMGVQKGESVITITRKESILLHVKCGFYAQFNRNKVIFSDQKRMWPTRLRIKRIYYKLIDRKKV